MFVQIFVLNKTHGDSHFTIIITPGGEIEKFSCVQSYPFHSVRLNSFKCGEKYFVIFDTICCELSSVFLV